MALYEVDHMNKYCFLSAFFVWSASYAAEPEQKKAYYVFNNSGFVVGKIDENGHFKHLSPLGGNVHFHHDLPVKESMFDSSPKYTLGTQFMNDEDARIKKDARKPTFHEIVFTGIIAANAAASAGWTLGLLGNMISAPRWLYIPSTMQRSALQSAARGSVRALPAAVFVSPFVYEKFYGESAYRTRIDGLFSPWYKKTPERLALASAMGGAIGAITAAGAGVACGVIKGMDQAPYGVPLDGAPIWRAARKEAMRRIPTGMVSGAVTFFMLATPYVLNSKRLSE